MGNIYVCADLHFNHKNIITYENRPWPDREAMNRGIISNWNAEVEDGDTVYVLGDVGFCSSTKARNLVSQLRGYKILVMGNHDRDRSPETWKRIGFNAVFANPISIIIPGITAFGKNILLMHEPPEEKEPRNFYIYGHVHGDPSYPDWTPDSACVSIERLNFAPAKLQSVLDGTAYAHRQKKEATE